MDRQQLRAALKQLCVEATKHLDPWDIALEVQYVAAEVDAALHITCEGVLEVFYQGEQETRFYNNYAR